MKIAVNTRFLLKDKLEGIGRFTCETLRRITREHPEHEFHFFFDRAYSEEFIFSSNIVPHVLHPQARHPFLWYWWFEHSIPRALKKIAPEVFLSPDGYLSLSANVKQVPVIHDLAFVHRPDDIPFLVRRYYHYYFPRFAHKASRIATVSEFSRNDISKHYGISEEKIDVVYNGVSEIFKPSAEPKRKEIREKYSAGKPYMVYVGALHPRKNAANLLRAFDQFKTASGTDIRLLVVGRKAWQNEEMHAVYESMQHKNDVDFTGRLPDADLAGVMASALALVYVPFFEGFGLPVAEAMRCGVPVITSGLSSLPEVGGDAAIYCDPNHIEEISNAMKELCLNGTLRETLAARALERSSAFTWERTSTALWESVQQAINA